MKFISLKQDISEQEDLASTLPGKAKELTAVLKKWRSDVKANIPEPNPDLRKP